ncbi:hypothetical protein EDD11_002811 [Mortierella claussenii]|nr:hypothetical protein EDD11_002811 [Mortierella claussenii]
MTILKKLFCLVDGEIASHAFSIEVSHDDTVGDLKEIIKAEKTPESDDIDAVRLALWRVSIPFDSVNRHTTIVLAEYETATEATELNPIDNVFQVLGQPPIETIHVIVERPSPALKRDREEDAELSSMRKHHRPHTLLDAIEVTGLTQEVIVNGRTRLSLLDNKKRILLLGLIGQMVDEADAFTSLSRIAHRLQGTDIEDVDKLSAPRDSILPVVHTTDLYVREAYKELHRTILSTFDNSRQGVEVRKHVVVIGTSGIGTSAFLVYFAIRLLAESSDDNPPIIIFHTKRRAECYVFGGRSIFRSGNIEDFIPFLNLPDTWYFVDSSPDPILNRAKTIIAASPKTLYSEAHQYQDVDKKVPWRYYMAPWTLDELRKCRTSVAGFKVVPVKVVDELYSKIGGVPRYVLEKPMMCLNLWPNEPERAKENALERLEQDIHRVNEPVMLLQFFSQGKDTLDFSSHLIHRWPTDDHDKFRLEWASTYVAEKVTALLSQDAYSQILKSRITNPSDSARSIMF